MAQYFDLFPKIPYSIGRDDQVASFYDVATNIFVRVRVIVEKLDQIFHYYEYTIKDGETPEILAEKYYGDPEAHWLVLITNNKTDPQFDWPLMGDNFNNYVANKYGSVAIAQTTIHHFEKVYKTVDSYTGTETYKRVNIETNPVTVLTINNAGRGYSSNGYISFSTDYGTGANASYTINANGSIISVALSSGGDYVSSPNASINASNTATADIQAFSPSGNTWLQMPTDLGSPISTTVGPYVINTYSAYRNSVTNYDWEFEENEKKRRIKLIKPAYFASIKNEFNTIMQNSSVNIRKPGIRVLT